MLDEVREGLKALGVPDYLRMQVNALPAGTLGVLVYGSRARGDAIESSDLDLLALVSSPTASVRSPQVSISCYTEDDLMKGVGTLFGAHLARDAVIVCDPLGILDSAIRKMPGLDVENLVSRVKWMSQLFTTPDQDLPQYLDGLMREARYLLRSTLYAKSIENGSPCFSVREIATRLNNPRLEELLASRQESRPTLGEYQYCLQLLREQIGAFPESVHGSLEATVVNEWWTQNDLLSVAWMALGSHEEQSDYEEVGVILL